MLIGATPAGNIDDRMRGIRDRKLTNPNSRRFVPGRRASDVPGAPLTPSPSQALAASLLDQLLESEHEGKSLTAMDLRRKLDIPLEQLFVGLRWLEFDGLIVRGNPSLDPLDSPISLTERARKLYSSPERIRAK